ncbi:MAG: hypothetical protein JNL28_02420 [Planctomycetes bacterium]|nr:hypothetical protein [Planctomycetota bacterium]
MKRSRIILPLCVAAGVAAGLVAVWMTAGFRLSAATSPATAPVHAQSESDAPGDEDLELTQAAPGRTLVHSSGDGGASLSPAAERANAKEPRKPATAAELQEFRRYVDDTLHELRRDQALEWKRDLVERADRMDDTVRTLERKLGLSVAQSARLRTTLLAQLDLEAEYAWKWEQGADKDALGRLKVADREARLRELAQFLSAEQLVAYKSAAAD